MNQTMPESDEMNCWQSKFMFVGEEFPRMIVLFGMTVRMGMGVTVVVLVVVPLGSGRRESCDVRMRWALPTVLNEPVQNRADSDRASERQAQDQIARDDLSKTPHHRSSRLY